MNCIPRNYQESIAYCKSIGHQIASFHSNEDIDAVKDYFNKDTCHSIPWKDEAGKKVAGLYIGANKLNGKWTWEDGSKWWLYNKNDGVKSGETKVIWYSKDGEWHDWQTGNILAGVICQTNAGN